MESTPSDPVIDEVRAVRRRISERVGHNSARLVAYYMEFQERYRERLIRAGAVHEVAIDPGLTSGCSGPAARATEPGREMQPRTVQPSQAPQQADSTLQLLMQSVCAVVLASPVDVPAVMASLVALLEYLSSPAGRTDSNCCAVDRFFCLDDDFPLERLPDSLQDVFTHMDALHDTVTSPQIAENFGSTPEQLLERVRNASI